MQGAKSKSTETFGTTTYSYDNTLKLDYLNIPVIAKYFVAEKFSLQAGPQIGFLLSGKGDYKETVTTGGVTTSNSSSQNLKENVKSTDFGFNFGIGYEFTKELAVDLRYYVGLSDINKHLEGDTSKIKNNNFSLTLDYKF